MCAQPKTETAKTPNTAKSTAQTLTISQLAETKYTYKIPDYQRGYRWGESEVRALLDDINEVHEVQNPNNITDDDKYCLQPISLDTSEEGNKVMIVVDGQQRLTTLYLVMHYIRKVLADAGDDPAKYIKGYKDKVRHLSSAYKLEYVNVSRQAVFEKVCNMLDSSDEPSKANIDMYYMTSAYKVIKIWMQELTMDELITFATKLYDQTTVIWYEIAVEDGDADEYFAKINSGKIQLTNGELIKANVMLDEYVLTQADKNFVPTPGTEGHDALVGVQKEDFYKFRRRQLDNERIKIARQWDEIEAELHKVEFWGFIATKSDTKKYTNTRIDFLFDMIASEKYMDAFKDSQRDYQQFCQLNTERATFIILERYLERHKGDDTGGKSVSAMLWSEVWNRYMTLKEWFEDRDIYHYVGYIILKCDGYDAKRLLNETKGLSRKKLRSALLSIIRGSIGIYYGVNGAAKTTKADFEKHIDELQYNVNNNEINRVLVLFNIISILLDKAKSNIASRDSFFPFTRYSDEAWNLEHVHSVAKKFTVDTAQKYVRHIKDMIALLQKSGIDDDDFNALVKARDEYDKVLKEKRQETNESEAIVSAADACAELIDQRFNTGLGNAMLNGMGNMALLDEKTNKSYRNAPFFMKRMVIKDIVRGEGGVSRFIPICTRNVFDKSYSDVVGNMLHWTQTDADSYKQAIKDTLWQYLGV